MCELKKNNYSSLIEQTKDGIIIIDEEIIQFTNEAAAEIIGCDIEELIGKSYISIVVPELKEISAQRCRLCQAGKYISFHETKFIGTNRKTSEVGISASPVRCHDKTMVMAIVHNLTEHKRQQEEVQKNQKLESLGLLAGGIAHDFNNLLAVIIGNLSLVRTYGQPGYDLLAILEETRKAAWQARDLTQQLFTFARPAIPVKRAVSLSKLIKEIAASTLSGSKTRCEFSLRDDLWCSEIDEGQIGQVIRNLIMNADQAMAGAGLIEIRAENVIVKAEDDLPLKKGKYTRVSVKDYGIGIREENLQKIFDPYFTTKQKGSGFGLAISYAIVKRHEGYISVESKPGGGTTFHVYLPAIEKCFGSEGSNEGENRRCPGENVSPG
ncbi:MAG: ATP-binding protein [bacterium]